jgi:hypothetical protein
MLTSTVLPSALDPAASTAALDGACMAIIGSGTMGRARAAQLVVTDRIPTRAERSRDA